MMTFKQLEAIYWVARLGGFSQAAQKLHTTQSAVSKRVLELEDTFGMPMFDRTLRASRLTEKGEEMFAIAKDLLERREAAIEKFARADPPAQRLRIGVTELVAVTWLPRFVTEVRRQFPHMVFEPDVDNSFQLRNKLIQDNLDIAILPDLFDDSRIAKTTVGKIRNVWMAKPGLLENHGLTVHDIAEQRMLTFSSQSATGVLYDEWLRAAGVSSVNRIVTNSLVTIIGMTVSGLGVGHLPEACLQPMIDMNMLEVLSVTPPLPDIVYVAAHKSDRHSTVIDLLVKTAKTCCDFSQAFQTIA